MINPTSLLKIKPSLLVPPPHFGPQQSLIELWTQSVFSLLPLILNTLGYLCLGAGQGNYAIGILAVSKANNVKVDAMSKVAA